MKESLMEIIVCPMCKGILELTAHEKNNGEIINGSLYCKKCDQAYQIKEGIPNLLPPDIRS